MKYLAEIGRSLKRNPVKTCRHDRVPWKGDFLAEGADGKAFQSLDDETKVVKIGFIGNMVRSLYSMNDLEDNFDYIHTHNPAAYVTVHNYSCINCRDCNIGYFVVMDKLVPIGGNVQNVVALANQVQALANNKKRKNEKFPTASIHASYLSGVKEIEFAKAVWTSGIVHNDIHYGNVMKTTGGDYKLIDLDRLTFTKFAEKDEEDDDD